MTAQEMWARYVQHAPECQGKSYEAWCYGSDTPDMLAQLTLAGVKTATASAYPFYEYENCPLPQAGSCNIILDTHDAAVCITETLRVTVVPFCEVSAEHAYKEGEGDKSLAYWRRVHEEVFTQELREINAPFSQDMPVVCEEFAVVYPAK